MVPTEDKQWVGRETLTERMLAIWMQSGDGLK